MTINQLAGKLKEALDSVKVKCFLVADTARLANEGNLSDVSVFTVGVKAEDFVKKTTEIAEALNKEFAEVGGVAQDIFSKKGFTRAFKLNFEKFLVVVAAYFTDGENRICPFTVNEMALTFPVELLDDMKKKKIGNKWFPIPSPIEDYLEATYFEDGRMKKQMVTAPLELPEDEEEFEDEELPEDEIEEEPEE